MSQEPPRVSFPGTSVTSQNSVRQSKNNAGRVVAIVLGTLFTFLFLCSGAAVVTYRRFNADSNFGGKFDELREPIGGAIPNKARETAQRAGVVETDEADEITQWLENEMLEVDKSRLVMEMQRSGLSNGLVNPLTRVMWTLNLDEALEPLQLGDRVVVLDFEWLVKDKEARVVVASFSTYGDDSYVHVLYLNRQDDQWKLFDWRDVLLPMSEAQYWAVYAGLDDPEDRAYYEFTDTAYKIYTNESLGASEKIKQTLSAFKSTKFPRLYNAMAQDSLCTWLVHYNAKEELAEVVKQLRADEFAGALLFKAQSAAWSNETELAFQYLQELNTQVGWHPKAAHMAAEFARTSEQEHLAADWLARAAVLTSANASILSHFFNFADLEQIKSLFQQIAKTRRPSAHTIKLVQMLGDVNERQLQLLSDLTQPITELKEAHQYLELMLAVEKEDYAEVLSLAPKIMQLESLSDTENQPESSGSVSSDYLTAAAKSNSLVHAAELAPNRDEFLTQVRDRAMYGFFDLPPEEAAALLKSIPDGHTLRDGIQTPIAIAKMDVKRGNSGDAFDSLLAIYKENESGITSDEPIEFTYPLLKALAQAALASERWRELIDIVDTEVLLLMLAWSDEIQPDQLQHVLAWYEGDLDQTAYWAKFFRARSAFENGDWTTVDRLIVEAITLAEQDLRVTEGRLPPLVAMLIDYDDYDEYSEYESNIDSIWAGLRLSYATRCNALDRLVAEAQVADRLDAGWIERISDNYLMASIESQEKIASILNASPLAEAHKLAAEIRTSLLVNRGQFAEAFDKEVTRAQGLERDSFEQRWAILSAGSHLLASGDKRRVDPLRQVSRGTEADAYVDCVAAVLDHDVPTLCKTLERWEATDWHFQEFVDSDVLKRLQGLPGLHDISAVKAIDVSTMQFAFDESLLVLATDSTQAAVAFEQILKSKAINYKVLATSRFDQATAAFEIKTDDGEFVMVFRSTSEEAFAKNAVTHMFAKDARALAICVRKDIDMQQPNSRKTALRTTLNDLLEGLPAAVALRDVGTTSVFCGADWQSRFGQSLNTGIDLAHPKEFYSLLEHENAKWFVERDGQSYVVLSEARELIPVKLESQVTPWSDEVGVTLASSIIVPCLPADISVAIER